MHRVLVGKPEGKRPLGRRRCRWQDNIKMVAMRLPLLQCTVLVRQCGCHVITYCNAQSIGQAIWLPCDYLLHCTEYWPVGMVAMRLLTAVNRVLARWYGWHEITYCNAQSIGQVVWLPCDYLLQCTDIGQAIWLPCDYLLQCTEYWPGNMVAM